MQEISTCGITSLQQVDTTDDEWMFPESMTEQSLKGSENTQNTKNLENSLASEDTQISDLNNSQMALPFTKQQSQKKDVFFMISCI